MKYLKMLGLAAVAAAVMAIAGVSTASANTGVLCKEQVTPCGNKYKVGTAFDASLKASTSVRFKTTSGEEFKSCATSTLKSELTANPDASGEATTKNTALTFENCTPAEAVTLKLGKLRVQNIAGNWNGTVFADELIEITLVNLTSCVYTIAAGEDIGEIKEGKPATLVVNAVMKKPFDGFCPETLRWQAEYTITEPANETLAVSPK